MHAALARHTNARIVPAECCPQPDGTYRLIYHKPILCTPDNSAEDIAQQCWNVLEPSVRRHPERWLWSYKHWRFRPDDQSQDRYPFYANSAKRFDKKLREQALAAEARLTLTTGG